MLHLAVIIFRDARGNILLQFRDSAAPTDSLAWSLFGGMAEGSESPTEAVIRETEEELGLRLGADDLRVLAEFPWVDPPTKRDMIVHFHEGVAPIGWEDIVVREGAGAAFLPRDAILRMREVSGLAALCIREHC